MGRSAGRRRASREVEVGQDSISSRDWIRNCANSGAGAAIAGSAQAAREAAQAGDPPAYNNYYGDLHNHNQVGYAHGT